MRNPESTSNLAAGGRFSSGAVLFLVLAAFSAYAARMFGLISRYAVNIFFSDQWEFNDATLFQKHSFWQMFAWQHGPHRQGLGALFAKLVDPLSHWNSRVESFVVGGVIVVAALCAILLKYRLYGKLSISDIAIPAILMTPGQWETWVVTPNFAHGPFPLLLIMLYFLAWTSRNRKLRYPLVLLINFLTIFTGFGLLLGLITPPLLILDYLAGKPPDRLAKVYLAGAIVVALASLGLFFIGWKFNPDLDCFSPAPRSPGWYGIYVSLMLANFFAIHGIHTFPRIMGLLILVAAVGATSVATFQLINQRSEPLDDGQRRRLFTSCGMIAYGLSFCLATAYGRLCGGLPQSSRYAIYVGVAILGLYLYFLSLPPGFARRWSLAVFLAAVLTASLAVDRSEMFYYSFVKREWKACYIRTEDIVGCNRLVGFAIFSHAPERARLREKLEYLKTTQQNLYLGTP